MLQVDIEKIIPVTEARDMFNKIVDEVEGTDEMYVLTKNGKPSAVIVGVNHLEKLTGDEGSEVMAKISDLANEQGEVPVAPTQDSTALEAVDVPATPVEGQFDMSAPVDNFAPAPVTNIPAVEPEPIPVADTAPPVETPMPAVNDNVIEPAPVVPPTDTAMPESTPTMPPMPATPDNSATNQPANGQVPPAPAN